MTRSTLWPTTEAALAHFAAKSKFARWAPGVLADYIDAGTEPADGQVQLRFRREVETQVYNTLPHHLGALLRRHPPRCAVALVAGTRSVEMRQGGLGPAHALAGERLRWIEGSHLYPMERPDETAATVLALLQDMPARPSVGSARTPPL